MKKKLSSNKPDINYKRALWATSCISLLTLIIGSYYVWGNTQWRHTYDNERIAEFIAKARTDVFELTPVASYSSTNYIDEFKIKLKSPSSSQLVHFNYTDKENSSLNYVSFSSTALTERYHYYISNESVKKDELVDFNQYDACLSTFAVSFSKDNFDPNTYEVFFEKTLSDGRIVYVYKSVRDLEICRDVLDDIREIETSLRSLESY